MDPFVIDDRQRWPLGFFSGLAVLPSVVHAVTTRDGPAFGDDATSTGTSLAVQQVAVALHLEGAAWSRQVHGAAVLRVHTPGLAGEADGLVTDTPGLAVLCRSADCPLVLVAGLRADQSPAVGLAHASWRSTVRGITATVMARLRDELGVDPDTVHAGIAPSAGPCCYEVGDEVRDEALVRLGGGAARWFFKVKERWHLDLWSANLAQLTEAGVPASQVWGSGTCTICQGKRFWSWRNQGAAAGRFAAIIGVS